MTKEQLEALESTLRGWVASTGGNTHDVVSYLWSLFDGDHSVRDHVVRALSSRRGVPSVALAALGRSWCDAGRARLRIMGCRDSAMLRAIALNYIDGLFHRET